MGFNKDKKVNEQKVNEKKVNENNIDESEKLEKNDDNIIKDEVICDESLKGEDEECSNCDGETLENNQKDEKAEDLAETEVLTAEQILNGFKEENKELRDSNKKLLDSNKRLNNEMETLKDRTTRTVSEYENYRKRTIKEKESIYSDACEDVLKDIFPVLDNLERAAVVDGSVEDIKKGIDITLRQFKDALKKLQIEEISIESGFDPSEHNAVMHVEDESLAKSQVVEVFQKGYKKGDKVLRYSMVKVAN